MVDTSSLTLGWRRSKNGRIMFGSLGFNEILFIMVLALLIFGPKRLPQIGRTIGKTMGEFRRATNDLKQSMEVEMTLAEERERAAKAPQPKPATGTEPRQELTALPIAEGEAEVETGAEAGAGAEPAAEPVDDQPDFGVPEPVAADETSADADADSAAETDRSVEPDPAVRPPEGS